MWKTITCVMTLMTPISHVFFLRYENGDLDDFSQYKEGRIVRVIEHVKLAW